jgi:predicted negative regulator of RcsB-dependent stress response
VADKDRKEDAETQGADDSDEEASSSEEGSSEEESAEETEGGEGADSEAEGDEAGESAEAGADDEEEEAEAPKPRARRAKPAAPSKKAASDDDESPAKAEAGDEGDDVSAERVARALGIEDDGEGEAPSEAVAEATEGETVVNRAARRREEALERRRKRKGKAAAATDADAADLPKDKNARAKELLKRRREQSTVEKQPINLLPAEMVDDALSRSASATGKWIRKNFNVIQWAVLAAAVGVGGFLLYTSQTEKTAAAATAELATGLSAERGRVMAEDKRSDEEKEFDPTKVYKTQDERADAALAGYRKAMAEHPGTPAALLAKLGEAGVLLEKRDWDGAIAAYGTVLSSKLAQTDIDVKGRCIEGVGMAKEGKGDLDGAIASYKELEGIDARGFKELGMYQQGRVFLAKGEKDKAKDILKMVREKLQAPAADGQKLRYLEEVVDETLRKIDPALVPTKAPLMGGAKGDAISPEQMEKIKKVLEEAAKKKPAEQH